LRDEYPALVDVILASDDAQLAIYIRDDRKIPRDRALRPSIIENAFERATARAQEHMDLSKGLPPGGGTPSPGT
jgi:hypothetical protein